MQMRYEAYFEVPDNSGPKELEEAKRDIDEFIEDGLEGNGAVDSSLTKV